MIVIGFESINPDALNKINANNWKLKQLQNYESAIEKIQSQGVVVYGAFVIGFDDDDLSTFDRIRDFVLKNKIVGQFTLLTPLPGSEVYEEMKVQGRLISDTFWDRSSFWEMTIKHDKLGKEEAEEGIIRLHEEVYSEENVRARNFHMMQIYKKLPPCWSPWKEMSGINE